MHSLPFPPEILRDVARRRTFAIISHPDPEQIWIPAFAGMTVFG